MRVSIILIGLGLALGFSSGVAAQFIPGDINDDGIVDIVDPTVLRRHLADLGPGIRQGVPDPNAPRFVDPNDGTIIDNQTGLMWEKKDDSGGIHDKNNTYTWSAIEFGTLPDGTAFTVFLGTLNNCVDDGTRPPTGVTGGFAGYCDWRIPTIVELQTILLEPSPCGTDPCIDPIFGPTASDFYWSATSFPFPDNAWFVYFVDGGLGATNKNDSVFLPDAPVRAVRGGL